MSTMIEDRLRRHYDERTAGVPAHGPGLEGDLVVRSPGRPTISPSRRPGAVAAIALGAVAAAALVAVVVARSPGDDTVGSSPSSPPSRSAPGSESTQGGPTTAAEVMLMPVETLPATGDVSDTPVTVSAGGPTEWYRLQPDLDVAWYQEPQTNGPSMLCLRTPVHTRCQIDDGDSETVSIASAGGQTLVIAQTPSTELWVQTNDGTVHHALVDRDGQIGWGVARFELPSDASITFVGDAPPTLVVDPGVPVGASLPDADADAGAATGPTPTVPAGSELSYWRWLPDLDVSERETKAIGSGTELCWRTSAARGCLDDTFLSPEVGVIPTDGGAIALARPALVRIVPAPTDPMAPSLEIGPAPTLVTANLSDGTVATAGITFGPDFGVGYARFDLANGVTITSASSS